MWINHDNFSKMGFLALDYILKWIEFHIIVNTETAIWQILFQ